MQIFSHELDILSDSIWNRVETTDTVKSDFIYLQEVGFFHAKKRYFTTRQGLDSFLIKLTISGCGILEYNGQVEHVRPGQFFWIDCANWQKYYTAPETGSWDVIWVHFNGTTARAYYENFCKLRRGDGVGTLSSNSSMYKLLDTLLKRTSQDYSILTEQNLIQFDIVTSGILTQLIMECISSTGSTGELMQVPQNVSHIRSYLSAHYNEKITLEHLSVRFNLDPFYLQKLFKRHVGQSPMEYLIHLRMTHAKSLMSTTTMSISEIAYTVGIDNISHFTRLFKKREGITPNQYRKFWPMGTTYSAQVGGTPHGRGRV